MKLKPETLAFLRNLSKQERQAFIDYLHDADENVAAEVNHLDNEMGFVQDAPVEPNES
jgi:hypothetical protein